jgi:methylated-DNA-[protein]-cysteine S-methyltransferase
MDVLRAPAYKNMDDDQLRAAITLGKDILEGRASLVELNDRSLKLRGKTR